ncbi:replicative DNA helicase [Candidatus Poribacteria bacterium]|nr:MAG: replicative DNA helicase [Candidatus Poribacteria bacterium]
MNTKTTEPLHDREAEQAVLGSMMVDSAVIPRVIAILGHTSENFFTADHQLIYAAILGVYERHNKVDPLLVSDELERKNELNRAGGDLYLYDLQARIVETESTEFYAQLVREKSTRRQLVQTGEQISNLARDQDQELRDVLDQAQEGVFRIGQADDDQGFVSVGSIVKETLAGIEQLFHKQDQYVGIPTGFTDFDLMTSGLQRGDLIIIAARPSMGKSTLVLNMAQNIAIEQEVPVAIFSLEMPTQQVLLRMLAAEAQINFGHLRTGNLTGEDWTGLTQAVSSLMSVPIFINDTRGVTVQTLRAEGRRLKGEHNDLAVIIVDYLQLLSGSGRYTGRVEEISDISRALKTLAWELDTPIIACSQLSREVEKRPDKRPLLSDLRESGAIEQDADLVAFLYREDYYDEAADDQGTADLIIKKQRNGPTGTVRLEFNKTQMRFANMSYQ